MRNLPGWKPECFAGWGGIEALCGTVNINEVPGFRVENSPFAGIKDSGLGIKEGVIEAMKGYSYVKTFSLPW